MKIEKKIEKEMSKEALIELNDCKTKRERFKYLFGYVQGKKDKIMEEIKEMKEELEGKKKLR
jgi:hypothetical protein